MTSWQPENEEPSDLRPCLCHDDVAELNSSAARFGRGEAGVFPRHGGGHPHVRGELPHDAQAERGVLRRLHCPRKVSSCALRTARLHRAALSCATSSHLLCMHVSEVSLALPKEF